MEEDSVEMLEEEDVRWRRERFKSILGAGVIDVIGCGEAKRSMSRKVNCMRLCSHKRHVIEHLDRCPSSIEEIDFCIDVAEIFYLVLLDCSKKAFAEGVLRIAMLSEYGNLSRGIPAGGNSPSITCNICDLNVRDDVGH